MGEVRASLSGWRSRVAGRHLCALALAAGAGLLPAAARAHPHVWVTVKTTVLYANGTITGLRAAWTFDEAYTAMAIEGLDANRDGKYDRQELAELAKVNIDGLKDFHYFTSAKLGEGELKFKEPVDYWLEHTDGGILTLHFTLPLEQPVPAETPDFKFAVFDPSYFIAFDLAKEGPVTLGPEAPADCRATVRDPIEEDAQSQALNEAFSGALGGGSELGFGTAQTVTVRCAKS